MADLADYYGIYDPAALDEAFLNDIGPDRSWESGLLPEECKEVEEDYRREIMFEWRAKRKRKQNYKRIKSLRLTREQIESFCDILDARLDRTFGVKDKDKLYELLNILLEGIEFFPDRIEKLIPPEPELSPRPSLEDEDIPF